MARESLSLSLMFPTIYGVTLRGLGNDIEFGTCARFERGHPAVTRDP